MIKYKDSTDKNSNEIYNLNDWENLIFNKPGKQKHWREGRSAYAIANYMMGKGCDEVTKIISKILGEDIELKEAIPELEIKFDKFGHGREHDLGIYGETKSGKTIFIGIESKVDESFNKKVSEVYLDAKVKEFRGENTNVPQRIEDLIKKMEFNKLTPEVFDLRYQLLYAVAGTAMANADIKILMFIVFKTELYDETKGKQNHKDYLQFIKEVNSTAIKMDGNICAHELTFDNKKIYSLYITR